jgi:hypothetical protein
MTGATVEAAARAPLEPDRDQLEIFVNGMLRYCGSAGVVSLRAFYEDDSGAPFRITPISLKGGLPFLIEAAEDDARRAANDPKPVVFSPPVATFAPRGRAREQDILEAPALSVELDQHPRDALAKLEHLLGSATLVVRSGGEWTDPITGEIEDKLHAHWRLKEPARGKDIVKLKRARQLATAFVGGDPTNVPACHPIRWPGSWHRKRAPRLCEIVSTDHLDNEIDLDFALAALEDVAPSSPSPSEDKGGGGAGTLDWSEGFGKIISGEQFHPVLVPLAASFAARGTPEAVTRGVLRSLLNNTQTADHERLKRRDIELNKLAATVRSGYDKFAPTSGALLDPWRHFIAPPFPLDTLPPAVQCYVKSQAAIIGCDISGMAMSVLGAFSGALHHEFALKMQRYGKWYERPRLWVLNVADPSQRKTPMLKATTCPVVQYEIDLRDKYDAELRAYEEAQDLTSDGPQLQKPNPPRRYVVWDTTVEKLGELLACNPKGLLVVSDEVSFWLGSMERYSNSAGRSDRGFWLQAYDGGPHNVDRIKRGSIHIKNLSVSLLGCIQPDRLAEMQGLTSDGLLQRFAPVMWGPGTFTQDCPCDDEAYSKLVRELIFAKPARLIMNDAALAVMTDLRRHLFDIEQTSGGLAAGFQTFVGKLHGIAGSLALILHMAHDPENGATYAVEQRTVENVRRLMLKFIIPHGYEFYQQAAGSERLRRVASWILTSGKQRVLASDLTTNIADCRGLALPQIQERVSPLVAGGWLEPETLAPSCHAWKVAPQVHTQLAERAKTEEARKATLAALMNSPRHGGGA